MKSIQQSSTPFDPHESASGNQTCKIFVKVPSTKKESEHLLVFFCLKPLKYLPSQCLSDQEQVFSFSASEIPELVPQSCQTLSDPMDCSPPGSSVHAVLQARILEWVAISFSTGSSRARDQTWVSCTAGRLFTVSATRGAPWDHKHTHHSSYWKDMAITIIPRISLASGASVIVPTTSVLFKYSSIL